MGGRAECLSEFPSHIIHPIRVLDSLYILCFLIETGAMGEEAEWVVRSPQGWMVQTHSVHMLKCPYTEPQWAAPCVGAHSVRGCALDKSHINAAISPKQPVY